jgi:hypothetical protein
MPLFINLRDFLICVLVCLALLSPAGAQAQVLDKSRLLARETFWDNRDFDWYSASIPFFDSPDAELNTTWYYRWELLTKHLIYGSVNSGYTFTEFIDRPFWSGAYGAISCPAGHQLYEARWLRQPRIGRDYARYWFRTPGAQPRNYSTWLADSVWALHLVHPEPAFTTDLLADLVRNFEAWEARHFVPEVGLFWQTGHDDGMEFNINSRQTKDILRGAPSFRPSTNAYFWADAMAIARIAELAGDSATAGRFQEKAARIKERLQTLLWDPERQFFFPLLRDNEERDGHLLKARTLTYQSGQFAGDPHGRELIGYVPWQFDLPDRDRGYEVAWKKLMDRDAFFADFGPTTVERHDPLFLLQKSCCWWSGQSWPYATTQTLKGLAQVLQNRDQSVISAEDYWRLLSIYARTHRKQGRPYLAEACHPDTGSFEGHDGYNHSEHYFHSGFCDLVITGLVGVLPRDDGSLALRPLAPVSWDYFCLEDLPWRGHRLTVIWDRTGQHYGMTPGFSVRVDGREAAHRDTLGPLEVPAFPVLAEPGTGTGLVAVNYAVNNDGDYFPRLTASHTAPHTSVAKVHDGNAWFHLHPPNRWTCEGSPNDRDTLELDLGRPRRIHTLKIYLLDDRDEPGGTIRGPKSLSLEVWRDNSWRPLPHVPQQFDNPATHRALTVSFPELEAARFRLTVTHAEGGRSGLTEWEVWGDARLPVEIPEPPAGNLAFNPGNREFPQASASFTDRFGGRPLAALDGKTVFLPTPMNRWTSYESKEASDWLEIDFGEPREFRRVELAIYDDRGGVQPPSAYRIETWNGQTWTAVAEPRLTPEQPAGGVWNEVRFHPVKAPRLRIVFTHRGQARSGVTEVMVWND